MDMSFPDSRTSFMQPPYGAWNHYPMNNPMNNEQFDPHSISEQQYQQTQQQQQQQQQPPFKKARHSEDNQSSPLAYQPMNSNSRMPPINPPVNKGISNIFYKTRMCAKFRAGACRNGENCNFAHGIEDLRQPPPNWQELVGATNEERERSSSSVGNSNNNNSNWDDDQKIIQRMKLCRKFCFGEECPYGERCNFLHEDPAKFREDSGRFRESSVISIGTNTGSPMGNANGSNNQVEVNRPSVNNAAAKPVYWKTKLCTKFEVKGHCQFGDKCHFAHGQAELQIMGGRPEGEAGNVPTFSATSQALPVNDASAVNTATVTEIPYVDDEGQRKKCLLKWRQPKKLNRIYADWIEDLPLGQNLANQVES